MKKGIIFMLLLIVAFVLCACGEDPYKRELDRANEMVQIAEENYSRAVQESNDLRDSISRINAAADALR